MSALRGECQLSAAASSSRWHAMRRILFLAVPVALAGCALPSRNTLSPYAAAPSLVDVAALEKFNGVLPLVTIPAGTPDWAEAVHYAVAQSLKIKPGAQFRVVVTAPQAESPEAEQRAMSPLAPEAAEVANAIVADGASAGNVSLGSKSQPIPHTTPPKAPEILVFAR